LSKKKNNLQDLDQNELEYNDGLGDMLREKDAKKAVGIGKIVMMVVSILIIVILFGGLSYKLGKKILVKKQHKVRHLEKLNQNDIALRINQIENEHKKVLKKIEADFANKRLESKPKAVIQPSSNVASNNQIATASVATVNVKPEKKVEKSDEKSVPVVEKRVEKKVFHKAVREAEIYPYKVIVGTFKNLNNAQQFRKALNTRNIETCLKVLLRHNGEKIYQVQAAAFAKEVEAAQLVKTLKAQGIDAFIK